MNGWSVSDRLFRRTSNVFSAVSVFRGSPGPGSHDENLDHAERHSSSDCNQEGALFAAQTGEVPDDSDVHWPAVVQTATRVSHFQYVPYWARFMLTSIVWFKTSMGICIWKSQSSFFYSFLWHIPLTFTTDTSSTIRRHLMTAPTGNSFLLLPIYIFDLP